MVKVPRNDAGIATFPVTSINAACKLADGFASLRARPPHIRNARQRQSERSAFQAARHAAVACGGSRHSRATAAARSRCHAGDTAARHAWRQSEHCAEIGGAQGDEVSATRSAARCLPGERQRDASVRSPEAVMTQLQGAIVLSLPLQQDEEVGQMWFQTAALGSSGWIVFQRRTEKLSAGENEGAGGSNATATTRLRRSSPTGQPIGRHQSLCPSRPAAPTGHRPLVPQRRSAAPAKDRLLSGSHAWLSDAAPTSGDATTRS